MDHQHGQPPGDQHRQPGQPERRRPVQVVDRRDVERVREHQRLEVDQQGHRVVPHVGRGRQEPGQHEHPGKRRGGHAAPPAEPRPDRQQRQQQDQMLLARQAQGQAEHGEHRATAPHADALHAEGPSGQAGQQQRLGPGLLHLGRGARQEQEQRRRPGRRQLR
jgi:hypothetical protein